MNNLRNEEKKFKSYLKKKVSFDLQTLVKFLITGVIAVSVTACGGGGGGGGSSSSNTNNIVNTGNITSSTDIEGKNYINEGNITIKASQNYALFAKNSEVINNGDIIIGDKNIDFRNNLNFFYNSNELESFIKQGYKIGIFSQDGNVINRVKGKIEGIGKKVIGVYLNKSKFQNQGNITMKGNISVTNDEINIDEQIGVWGNNSDIYNQENINIDSTVNTGIYTNNYPKDLIFSIGIKGENKSNIENIGTIKGKGNIIGIDVASASNAINNGEINLASQKIGANIIYEQGEEYHNNYNGFIYTNVIGMRGSDKDTTIINNKNINIEGQGIGILTLNEAEAINNGSIKLTSGELELKQYSNSGYELGKSWAQVIGMESDNSKITNSKNGIININGSGIGMYGKNNSALINDGIIDITGKIQYWTDSAIEGEHEVPNEYKYPERLVSYGMKIEDGETLINNGKINFSTEYYISSLENGEIVLNKYSGGIYAKNTELALNGKEGIIHISGSSAGMLGEQGSSLQNDGKIIIDSGRESLKDNYGNLILGTIGMLADTGNITNNGEIISNSNIQTDNVIGILNQNGNIENNGKILLSGKNVIGILSNGNKAENTGIINIVDVLKENSSSYDNYGMKAGEREGLVENVTLKNHQSGNITVTASSDIVTTNGELYRNIGMGLYGNNSSITNDGNITVNTQNSPYGVMGIGLFAKGSNNIVKNNSTINIEANSLEAESDSVEEIAERLSAGIKIKGSLKDKVVNSEGATINISGSGVGIYGIETDLVNAGNINLTNPKSEGNYLQPIGMFGYQSTIENKGNITGNSWDITGMLGNNQSTLINSGMINLTGLNVEGMALTVVDSTKGIGTATNNGNIIITGDNSIGMEIDGSLDDNQIPSNSDIIYVQGINEGTITIAGNESIGMRADKYSEGINNNLITIGNGASGMLADEGKATNNGTISVEENSYGMIAQSSDSQAINGDKGVIIVSGENSYGMVAKNGENTNAINNGIIKVGTGAYGMLAESGGTAINNGTIDVTAGALGGMIAKKDGYIENSQTGVINIDVSHNLNEENKEKFALQTQNGGMAINNGTINTNGNVSIEVGSTYIVGTNSDGTFGKLAASDVDLNGNLVISTDIVKGSYEESYKLDNMIEGENINLGEEYKNLSNSILYDAKTSKDKNGNLDGELVRNGNSISDFTNDNLTQVGELFDKYLAKENYEKLSQEDKELVDKIFTNTDSAKNIDEAIKKVAGQEYLNISRQIFDIKDSFRIYDSSIISTLDRYDYNFTLIGEYGDIQSKDGIVGYDTKMTGFNGAMKLADNLYGTLGYGYSDIDYDNNAEGKIQTIHGAIYKDYGYNKYNIRAGVFGEYNFHEIDRDNLNGNVNTDYNSYLVGATGEISKKYGDTLYVQPRLALDIAYGNVENFSEDSLEIKEQKYTSILPKAELIVGKKLNNIELFAKSSYSYELGKLDKDMDIKLLNNTVGIDNDTMDKGNLDLSIGTEVNFESLSLSAELGKEFGKRDREYVKAGITYKF